MPTPDPLNSPVLQSKALVWLLLGVTLLFLVVLWPLSGALSWAVFMAIVFSPLQERSALVCRGRRGWAAFGTLVVIIVSVLLPTALLSASITHEATAFYARFKSGDIQLAEYFQRFIDVMPAWVRGLLDRFGLADLAALQRKLVDALGTSSQALTSRAFLIGQGTLDFVVSFFVMLYVLFFFLRDGRALAERAADSLPLEPRHTRRLLAQFATVVRATVKGNVVVALVQGTLGGLAFWVLGVNGALLWGALMALLSLLPAVGAALVWGPVALYLLSVGSTWQGVALALWGVLVIGLVDNVLRPILVGKETRLPDYLVLVATLGGLSAFGLNGFVIGPVIAAIFLATWEIFVETRKEG
ncbi:AI-2E family transporter [Caenimonas aquaedulcis]|uniref:AI-2E family transporter n=1 Tax=Caenimonas aquaedulcis TaxID=2793270 RepID=A0A931MI86_9BURK|nr:AI-2E family transporter [Caenimonas aquaedulcis]MBG9389866.1 AI-2E family transporter [Caenimonas aquaedulcis]